MKSKKELNKQERIVRRRKNILAISIILFVALISISFFSIKSKADESKEVYKYYKSYEIQPGDTLWSIAADNLTTEYNDIDDYILEMKRVNHLLDDDITSGQYLVIAYYSYDEQY